MKKVGSWIAFVSLFSPLHAQAHSEWMGGERGMMTYGGGHMAEWGMAVWFVFGIVYLVGIVLFFWLLFRMARALEKIAEGKEKEKT